MSRVSRRCEPVPEEVREAADLLERRWQLSIIYAALTGALRFNEFAEAVAGISPRMLSERLRDLEAAGLVAAHRDPLEPPDRRVPPHRARAQARSHDRSHARVRPGVLERLRTGESEPGRLALGPRAAGRASASAPPPPTVRASSRAAPTSGPPGHRYASTSWPGLRMQTSPTAPPSRHQGRRDRHADVEGCARRPLRRRPGRHDPGPAPAPRTSGRPSGRRLACATAARPAPPRLTPRQPAVDRGPEGGRHGRSRRRPSPAGRPPAPRRC